MKRQLRLGTIGGVALALAALALPASAQETLLFDGNTLFGNGDGSVAGQFENSTLGGDACDYDRDGKADNTPHGASDLALTAFVNNRVVDPLLSAGYDNPTSPNFAPQVGSPLLLGNGAPVIQADDVDPWFDVATFQGAMDATNDWTQGWTYYAEDGGFTRTDLNAGKPTVTVNSNIAVNTVWSSANNYALVGRIAVQPGVTLTIQAGTAVLGQPGTNAYLVVERDGDLVVSGTAQAPVVFTSGADWTNGLQLPGDWGGVVIHGKAAANCAVGGAVAGCNLTSTGNDCESEGGAGFFGGSDDNDNSGSIRYARVEYAGREISPNNELNAWTFNAVGAATTLEYLQAHLGTDDLFEWFGGTARARWLVATAGADDGLDWQMGFRGRVQYAVVSHASTVDGDKGIEADNNEFDFDCPGRSNPYLANLTLIGGAEEAQGIHLRRGTAGKILNSVIVDFPGSGFRVQHAETLANCPCERPLTLQATPAPGPVASFAAQISPNPVVGQSSFRFKLPSATDVKVHVYNAAGRLVDTVHDGALPAGFNTVTWSPREVAGGVYFYRVVAGPNQASGKVLVVN